MASVGGNDTVILLNPVFEIDRDGFLEKWWEKESWSKNLSQAYLADREMAVATDKFVRRLICISVYTISTTHVLFAM
jgi:hypothetical protein